jgi:hypothetical protein
MNRNIFENNLRLIKEMNAKQSKEINPTQDKEFRKWLEEKGLIHWLK